MDVNHQQERDQLELLAANAIAWTSFVRRHAHAQPVDVALRSDGHGITYKELDARFDRIAAAFSRLGVGVGGRVGILMANRIEYIEALGGIMRLGAIAVPLNFRLVAAEVAHLLHDSGASLLVADGDRVEIAREAVAVTGDATPVVVVGDTPASGSGYGWAEVLHDRSGHPGSFPGHRGGVGTGGGGRHHVHIGDDRTAEGGGADPSQPLDVHHGLHAHDP